MGLFNGFNPAQLGIVACVTLTGCFAGPGFLKQNEAFQIQEAAIQIQTIGEVTQGTVSATSMTTQTLSAPAASSLAGVKLSVQPGTFSLDAAIALEESATLADGSMSQSLGLTLSSTAGKAVSVSAQGLGTSELVKPMTLAIPLSATSLMLADVEKILVIVYRTYKDGDVLDGVIPPEKIAVRNGQVIFDIMRWGAYQPAYVPKAEQQKVTVVQEVKSEAKIITATAMKELPKATISALSIAKGDKRDVTFSATLQNADIKKCYIDAYDTTSSERHYEELTSPSVYLDFSRDYEAMSNMVRIGCVLLDGRVLETAYTLFELPAIDRPAETASNNGDTSGSSGSISCDYSEMYPCQNALEYVRLTDEMGGALTTVQAGQIAYYEVKLALGVDIDISMGSPNNATNHCWHVPAVNEPRSRMNGGCESSWQMVGAAGDRTYRREFTPHYYGINNGLYQVASLRFKDTSGRHYEYFADANVNTYWNSTIPVLKFTYANPLNYPVDIDPPMLTSGITVSGSSATFYFSETNMLRFGCVLIAQVDNLNEFQVCQPWSGGYAYFATDLNSLISAANGAAVNAGMHYVKAISMEDAAWNWIEFRANGPDMAFYYYDENMTPVPMQDKLSTPFNVAPL